jgi:hypothetical protein
MARRAQLGAGIAAGIFAVVGLLVLLFAPIVPGCLVRVSFTDHCPPHALRYVALPQANLGADAWALLVGLLLVLLASAAGAIWDAHTGHRLALPLLWAGTVLAFAACSLASRGLVGLAYLPAVLALCLAACASLARRQLVRPLPSPVESPDADRTTTRTTEVGPPGASTERPPQTTEHAGDRPNT